MIRVIVVNPVRLMALLTTIAKLNINGIVIARLPTLVMSWFIYAETTIVIADINIMISA